MIEHVRYDREKAVEEGLRTTTEINVGYKRPLLRILKKNAVKSSYKDYKGEKHSEYEHETLLEKLRETPSNFSLIRSWLGSYVKVDKKKKKKYSELMQQSKVTKLNDLLQLDRIKKGSVCVYAEKQHNNIYTLRDFSNVLPNVAEVDLGEFYDIVGKVVVIELSKNKEVYKVHQILNVLD